MRRNAKQPKASAEKVVKDIRRATRRQYGDFGLGTFNALDAEMTVLDGVFYQCRSDGRAYIVEPTAQSPFAVVMRFDPTVALKIDEAMDFTSFAHALDAAVPSRNVF